MFFESVTIFIKKLLRIEKLTMNYEKRTCCFSGHRILPEESVEAIRKELGVVIDEYIKKGYNQFISGGALGFDLLAAKLVTEKRKSDSEIRLVMVLPCRDQHIKWSRRDKMEYEEILDLADEVKYDKVRDADRRTLRDY